MVLFVPEILLLSKSEAAFETFLGAERRIETNGSQLGMKRERERERCRRQILSISGYSQPSQPTNAKSSLASSSSTSSSSSSSANGKQKTKKTKLLSTHLLLNYQSVSMGLWIRRTCKWYVFSVTKNGTTPVSFGSFQITYCRITFRLRQESNLFRQSRRWARWPLDHHNNCPACILIFIPHPIQSQMILDYNHVRMDQSAFQFATRWHSKKGKQCHPITLRNNKIYLWSKQSSLFSFMKSHLVANWKVHSDWNFSITSSVTRKNYQMSIKVGQKWFH